ncbi:hypothetical protein PORY_001510 [Pneumocystis oryctolagi]|uniref:Uncharacterized protein n=1 Tax=Pneumocystis oryctolagi TaxID=42067 RepID=A0ACB7CD80_9ASCO|nr:hypothetical protein PORY_001510 [Pneumocystis oryctolagi]
MVDSKVEKVLTFFENNHLYVHSTWVEQIFQKHVFSNNEQLEEQMMYLFLNTDIKKTLTMRSCLPENIFDQHNNVLPGPYCLQVIQIQDIGISLFNQLEYLEQFDDSGHLKLFNIINDDGAIDYDDDDLAENNDKCVMKKMIKLLLEDASGVCVWANEYKPMKDIHLKMSLGSKILLRNVLVLRGVLVLVPESTTFLGGQVFELNQGYFPCGLRNQLKQKLYSTTEVSNVQEISD